VVPLPGGPHVLGAAALAARLDDGGDGGGALGGQVPPDPTGPVEGRLEDQVPVAEAFPAVVLAGVGRRAPRWALSRCCFLLLILSVLSMTIE
jgi:hypothetical protein